MKYFIIAIFPLLCVTLTLHSNRNFWENEVFFSISMPSPSPVLHWRTFTLLKNINQFNKITGCVDSVTKHYHYYMNLHFIYFYDRALLWRSLKSNLLHLSKQVEFFNNQNVITYPISPLKSLQLSSLPVKNKKLTKSMIFVRNNVH